MRRKDHGRVAGMHAGEFDVLQHAADDDCAFVEVVELAEDRKLFAAMLDKLKIPQPPNGLAVNEEEALEASERLGYPVLVRPSFVLGGRAMQIVYSDAELREYMRYAV